MSPTLLANTASVLAAIALALVWAGESFWPMFEARRGRLLHAWPHVALALLNGVGVGALFAGATLFVTEWARVNGFGLLHWLGLPAIASWIVALLLLDLWGYLWHRANHEIPLLWRFHAVHHSDTEVDGSTAFRFHTGEVALGAALYLALLPLAGITLPQLLLYKAILMPVAIWHHGNVRSPERTDRGLRWLVVSPRMHMVHHHRELPETDSNYSAVLSVWDRLLGTYREREPERLALGLDTLTGEEQRTLRGMLLTPFKGFPTQAELRAAAKAEEEETRSALRAERSAQVEVKPKEVDACARGMEAAGARSQR